VSARRYSHFVGVQGLSVAYLQAAANPAAELRQKPEEEAEEKVQHRDA
jgi:hypothetical protein